MRTFAFIVLSLLTVPAMALDPIPNDPVDLGYWLTAHQTEWANATDTAEEAEQSHSSAVSTETSIQQFCDQWRIEAADEGLTVTEINNLVGPYDTLLANYGQAANNQGNTRFNAGCDKLEEAEDATSSAERTAKLTGATADFTTAKATYLGWELQLDSLDTAVRQAKDNWYSEIEGEE